ncbi:PstS family phosphate ABC transporter substrate-binding protein [Steroidobacter sp.]|uniref:PstS family phosphate ABC transporter substrate-binding protein n=1 Tax=Steroidobacter sp. TaxID=1978227 RepID=UPI001A62B885|nr:substrate-binding domain-containing protein [Steroidobacter sp.]MBL8265800.1 hypothetical protein [Steroidobacter sp.]
MLNRSLQMFPKFALLALALCSTQAFAADTRDPAEIQKERNAIVARVGKATTYPADKFDLSALPAYKPRTAVSGTLKIWGNNYLKDGPLGSYWEKGFKKHHPQVKFDNHLYSAATAIGGLYAGGADIGASGRAILWPERMAFNRVFGYDPTEVVVATGSFAYAGWSNALGIFVHKDNPLTKISFEQIDAIFGAQRVGGWTGGEWKTDGARGAGKNIRTWGDLGLTGEWKDKPINPHGLNLRYEQSLRIGDPILKGSDKWSENMTLYANYLAEDGKFMRAAEQVMQAVGKDRYAIGYGGLMDLTEQTKVLDLARKAEGPYVKLTLENTQNRTYPLYADTFFYINRKPGQKIEPKLEEFLRFVLSREGQQAVARDGKYLPLPAEVVREQLKKLD